MTIVSISNSHLELKLGFGASYIASSDSDGDIYFDFTEILEENIYKIPDKAAICVGSKILNCRINRKIMYPLDDDEIVEAIYLLRLQFLLSFKLINKFSIPVGTKGIAVAISLIENESEYHGYIEGLRMPENEIMSGWYIFPDARLYGQPDYSKFTVLNADRFITNFPKVAKYLGLPVDYRFFTKDEMITPATSND